jgi:hypothetical protein
MTYYVIGVLQPDAPTDRYYTGPRVRVDEVDDFAKSLNGKPVMYEHMDDVIIGTVYKIILGDKNDIIAYLALDETIPETSKIIEKLKTSELKGISIRLRYSRSRDFTSFKNLLGIEISVVERGDIPDSHIIWHGKQKEMRLNLWAGYRRDKLSVDIPSEPTHNFLTLEVKASAKKMAETTPAVPPAVPPGLDVIQALETVKRERDEALKLLQAKEEENRQAKAAVEFKKEHDRRVFENITNDCLRLLPQIEGFSDEAAKKAFQTNAEELFEQCRAQDDDGFPPVLFAFASASRLVDTIKNEKDDMKKQLVEKEEALKAQNLKFSEIEKAHNEAIARSGVTSRGDGKSRFVPETAQASAKDKAMPESRKRASNAYLDFVNKYVPEDINAKRQQMFTKANSGGNGEEEEESKPEDTRAFNDRMRQAYNSRYGDKINVTSTYISGTDETN